MNKEYNCYLDNTNDPMVEHEGEFYPFSGNICGFENTEEGWQDIINWFIHKYPDLLACTEGIKEALSPLTFIKTISITVQ